MLNLKNLLTKKSLLTILSLILIFFIHLNYLNNGFTWLDYGDIELGRSILSLSRIPEAFLTRFGETGFYRPLVTTLNSLDYSFYKLWSPGYHLTNVFLHLAFAYITGLFAEIFFNLKFRERLLVILIVGVHPLGWLPVGQISYRPEILYSLFTLLTLYFHIKASSFRGGGDKPSTTNPESKFVIFTVISFLLALFSKETSLFIVPFLIFLWEITKTSEKTKKSKPWIFLFQLLTILIYLFLRFRAIPEIWRVKSVYLPPPVWVGTRLNAFGKLFLQLFIPFKPNLSDAALITYVNVIQIILLLLTFVLSIFLLKKGVKSNGFKLFVYFIISLFPSLNIIPLPRFYSPHYGYLAIPGIVVLIVFIYRYFSKNVLFGKIILATIVLWIIIAAFSTYRAGFRFKNDLTLFGPEVKKDPKFAEGHQYLGDYYFKKGNYKRAGNHYELALKKYPKTIAYVDRGATTNNLAGAYLAENNLTEAEKLLDKLLKANPNEPMLLYNRALVADKREDWNMVVRLLDRKNLSWPRPEPYLLLVKSLDKLGRNEEANIIMKKIL